MRASHLLIVASALLLAPSGAVSAIEDSEQALDHAIRSTETIAKRFLRSYENGDDEERVIINPKNLDDILNTKELDMVLDPKRADDLLKEKQLGGWLEKSTLDGLVNADLNHLKDVFAGWREARKTSNMVSKLIRSDPALEKKYRFVYKAYDGYLKKNQAKNVSGNKRKWVDI